MEMQKTIKTRLKAHLVVKIGLGAVCLGPVWPSMRQTAAVFPPQLGPLKMSDARRICTSWWVWEEGSRHTIKKASIIHICCLCVGGTLLLSWLQTNKKKLQVCHVFRAGVLPLRQKKSFLQVNVPAMPSGAGVMTSLATIQHIQDTYYIKWKETESKSCLTRLSGQRRT